MSGPTWYADGLLFSCRQSGHCCSGSPGYVWLSPAEQKQIAHHLGLELDLFRRRYTRLVGTMISLIEQRSGECIFLDEAKRCSIQPVKPRQCLTYPFWPRHLASARAWADATRCCPGVGEGRLYRRDQVETLLDRSTPREIVCRMMSNAPE